jgi:predicted DNA-binding ribbon-helix-helix protein
MTSDPGSGLISRNVTVNGRRTSLRLEPEMWEALSEMAQREGMRISDVISRIDRQHGGRGLTAQVRVAVLGYFRAAATERGHMSAGHGVLFGSAPRDRTG